MAGSLEYLFFFDRACKVDCVFEEGARIDAVPHVLAKEESVCSMAGSLEGTLIVFFFDRVCETDCIRGKRVNETNRI